jgi:hypothetical protein
MRAKNKYYKLDEVGFVGVQKSRTTAEIRKEANDTARSIKLLKARKSSSAHSANKASKHVSAK